MSMLFGYAKVKWVHIILSMNTAPQGGEVDVLYLKNIERTVTKTIKHVTPNA